MPPALERQRRFPHRQDRFASFGAEGHGGRTKAACQVGGHATELKTGVRYDIGSDA